MKGKQKYLHSVIMFFCKSTQNACIFYFIHVNAIFILMGSTSNWQWWSLMKWSCESGA